MEANGTGASFARTSAELQEPQQVCCSNDLKYERLRMLHFAAEKADGAGNRESQMRWAELQRFLLAEASRDPQVWWHTEALRDRCQQQLIWHATASSLASQQDREQAEALQAAGKSDDFHFTADESQDITELLKGLDPFRVLMPAVLPEARAPGRRPLQEVRQPPQPIRADSPDQPAAPKPAAGRKQDQQPQQRQPQQQLPLQKSRQQLQQKQQAKLPFASKDVPGSRVPKTAALRTAIDMLDPGQDHAASGNTGSRKRSKPEESSDDACEHPRQPILKEQPQKEAFQTARSKLASDAKKSGHAHGMDPAAIFSASNEAGPAGAPRAAGLARPNPKRGVRGGFVPPFARKAVEDPGSAPEAGVLSAKIIELLGGSDGQLPEALQKLDPNTLELVCNEILDTSSLVQWDDIAGQEHAKEMVQEVVVWPMLNPHLFQGARAPPKGLLLFGPPGTGKTLIGKAIASNISATFFNISSSSLVSKWIGEGEKMVRALFAVAGHLQPAVIFIDEIDSILTARKAEGEHEASRRLKTEMLVQMDGCSPDSAERRVLLVGATNRPQELDEAARRRMPKQLYIPLPCAAARRQMVNRQLGSAGAVKASMSEADIAKLVVKTDGYSGSDMKNLIQEACQGPVRDAVARHGSAIAKISEEDLRPVLLKDFQMATRAQRASVEPSEIAQYEQYNSKHGAHFSRATDEAMDEEDW
ncbi:hypothetical protein WJX74_000817 [Apatococcus lobatus]|uniref:AAA+ ATPase domain-containing protein n=1 Tax=Apatococcus lobatus TaxID=904363 RepID=A0AAW1S998_9CHLO